MSASWSACGLMPNDSAEVPARSLKELPSRDTMRLQRACTNTTSQQTILAGSSKATRSLRKAHVLSQRTLSWLYGFLC